MVALDTKSMASMLVASHAFGVAVGRRLTANGWAKLPGIFLIFQYVKECVATSDTRFFVYEGKSEDCVSNIPTDFFFFQSLV